MFKTLIILSLALFPRFTGNAFTESLADFNDPEIAHVA